MFSFRAESAYDAVVDPFLPATLGPLTLRNRIIKAATFEGRSPTRTVTPALIGFHQRVAAGGAGMSTVAFCAVSLEGTTDGHQIVLTEDAVPGMRTLTEAIHAQGAAACAQIGHAGPVANVRGVRPLAPSAVITPAMRRTRAATEKDITLVIGAFADAARCAARAGFDAVEIHMGHNYLISAFLSRRLNKRHDRWGGSLDNRARLARHVARAVREAAPELAVTAKVNMADGVRGGLDIEESLAIAALLQDDGNLDALELTVGSSLANPMFLFRGPAPRREFAATLPPALRAGFAVGGRFLARVLDERLARIDIEIVCDLVLRRRFFRSVVPLAHRVLFAIGLRCVLRTSNF